MRRSTLTIFLYLLVVFASGIVVGAFGYRLASAGTVAASATRPSPEEWRRQYLGEMESRLHLSAEQIGHLNSILDETSSRYHAARASHDTVMKTIKQEQTGKVRAILTPAQLPEYEKLRADREQRAKAANRTGKQDK